jgi:nondiscriminating glutamyl-tRNA synthetase
VLFNYLFTKKNNWIFLLRIEDTDRTRLVDWSVDNMLNILASVWLIADEGPNNPWSLWPYYQSERLDIYKKYIFELIEKDKAYYCFCSSERLTKLREEQQSLNLPTKYDKKCRYLTVEETKEKLDNKEKYTIRLKVPDNENIEFVDQVRWKITINSNEVDDQVLLKTDWFPTYHMAVVVDDYLMKVTDIIRWDEWIPSTPKHILLYMAFGWEIPKYSHVPPLVWADRKKLSKRTWDVAVERYLEKGYLVEALINFLALLGWNPKTTEEFFSMDELIEKFEISNVQKAGAFFDVERLNFFNTHYLKTMDSEVLYDKFIIYLRRYDTPFLDIIQTFPLEYNKKIFSELKSKIKKFEDYKLSTSFFYGDSKMPNEEVLINTKMKIENLEQVKMWLKIALNIVKNNNDFDSINSVKNIFVEEIQKAEMKNGQVLWPVRCALSWEQFSPGALELVFILGNKKSSERLQKVLDFLGK